MHQKSLLSLSLMAALGVFAGPLKAFSLGDIDVHSALNERFEADIALRSVRSDERDNLQVRLASEAEFERAGLARPFALTNLKFDVVENNNNVVVRVSSETPIKEPFLDFIVSATAGEGRMLREYTVLLDPPRATERRGRSEISQTEQPRSASESLSTADRSPSNYRVRNNDTLWQVAERVRPDSDLSVYQMMMALFEQNPQAFRDNNINNLRADATLNVPDRATINSLSATQARQAFNRQVEQWQQAQVDTPVPATDDDASPDTETSSQPAAEQISDETVDNADTQAASETASDETSPDTETLTEVYETGEVDEAVIADARLDLVAPNEELENAGDEISSRGDPELQQMSEQLTFAQETIEAQNQQNTDLKARMDKMEEQLETMRRLLSLKDADMARLQALLAENDGDIDDLAEALQAQQETDLTNNAETETASENAGENEQPDTSRQTAERSDDNIKNTGSRLSAILSDYGIPLALGLLLIVLLLLLMKRRRESLHEEDIFDTSDTAVSDYIETGDTNEDMVPPEVTEIEQTTPVVEETVNTAELIEQADMFVGYADYTQALNTLDQAQMQSPNDQKVIYKRLFVLYKLQRTNQFVEQLADAEFNSDSEEWHQIASWGRELDPNHPLFRDAPAPESELNRTDEVASPTEPTPDSVEPESQSQTSETVSAEYLEAFDSLPDEETPADEPDLEFILDEPPASQTDDNSDDASDIEQSDTSNSLQFSESSDPTDDIEPVSLDISDIETDEDADTQAEVSKTETSDEDDGISLDVSDDEQSHLSSDAPGVAPAPDKDNNDDDLTLDLSDYDDADEIETKLDLAAAYVEMDDPEAAREILEEVLSEGSEPQQQRARTLLNTLS